MIRFVTEAKADSPFVKLFNAAYGAEEKILYCTGSNVFLAGRAKGLAQGGNRVVVYMDMVSDNESLLGIYADLLDLYAVKRLDVVVMPIVCAEYLFVKSIVGVDGTIYSDIVLQELLSKSVSYKDSSFVKSLVHKPTNFEDFCKAFCEYCLSFKCCSVSSNKAGCKQPYFSDDCKCQDCVTRLTMKEKSCRFHSQYPIAPYMPGYHGTVVSWQDVLNESYRLVDEYNDWARAYGKGTIKKRYEA